MSAQNPVSTPSMVGENEMQLLRQLLKEKTGIIVSESNGNALRSKVQARITSLNLRSFSEYHRLLDDKKGKEIDFLINSTTVNFTSFMREQEHFHILTDKILPEILERNASNKKIRIWSSACSTGEEPYTLAIVLKEALEATPGWDIKIIATDVDTEVLDFADKGIYQKAKIEKFNPIRQKKWFQEVDGEPNKVRVKKEIRDMVEFRKLNLVGSWLMADKMDLIFCRNVMIYFDEPTRKTIVNRFVNQLVNNGLLVVSKTESLMGYNENLRLCNNSVYRLEK